MTELFQQIIDNPVAAALVIGNLVVIESLLSVDNAAVLATLVLELPTEQRKKALKYGIFGAYFFRGLSLFLASYLVQIWWLKGVGGLYLLYITYDWWRKRKVKESELTEVKSEGNLFYRATVGKLGKFWATVFVVEVMDLAFSIDNVFAAVAISKNIVLIICGVFIGILAMRFVAQGFVKLMEHYPFLEVCAYIVIAMLGLKLSLSVVGHFYPDASFSKILESPSADWLTSAVTICVFFFPLITCAIFGYPKKALR
jgi:YkoY family integral membrane protein